MQEHALIIFLAVFFLVFFGLFVVQPSTAQPITGLVVAAPALQPESIDSIASDNREIPPMPCLEEHGCWGEYCCYNNGFVPRDELTEEQITAIIENARF